MSFLSRYIPASNAALTLLAIAWFSSVDFRRIENHCIRRGIKVIPYLLPLLTKEGRGLNFKTTKKQSALIVLAILPSLLTHYRNRASLKVGLNRKVVSLMPSITLDDKISESLFFLAPPIAQEYYHRIYLPNVLVGMGLTSPIVIALTTGATFTLEHMFSPSGGNGHTTNHPKELIRWFALGTYWQFCALLADGHPLPPIGGHLALNLPRSIQPILRRTLPRSEVK